MKGPPPAGPDVQVRSTSTEGGSEVSGEAAARPGPGLVSRVCACEPKGADTCVCVCGTAPPLCHQLSVSDGFEWTVASSSCFR